MSKPIRTAAEAIKAVVEITRRCVYHDSAGSGFDEKAFEAAIRALPVAEAADDEALVEEACFQGGKAAPDADVDDVVAIARAVLSALREAGALR